jgi:hypothetical protein
MKSKWTGYYAVQVQIDVNEWALDGQITRGENNKPRLFTSKEEAQEHAKRWNTGNVIEYHGTI